jgi:hypothetical protein
VDIFRVEHGKLVEHRDVARPVPETARPDDKERTSKVIHMQRRAEPEEVAEAVIWLCSDAASSITGHVMPIDGGMVSIKSSVLPKRRADYELKDYHENMLLNAPSRRRFAMKARSLLIYIM